MAPVHSPSRSAEEPPEGQTRHLPRLATGRSIRGVRDGYRRRCMSYVQGCSQGGTRRRAAGCEPGVERVGRGGRSQSATDAHRRALLLDLSRASRDPFFGAHIGSVLRCLARRMVHCWAVPGWGKEHDASRTRATRPRCTLCPSHSYSVVSAPLLVRLSTSRLCAVRSPRSCLHARAVSLRASATPARVQEAGSTVIRSLRPSQTLLPEANVGTLEKTQGPVPGLHAVETRSSRRPALLSRHCTSITTTFS